MIDAFIFAVAMGFLFYLNFFLNPWLRLKEYRTFDAFKDSCKWLLVLVHLFVISLAIVLIAIL